MADKTQLRAILAPLILLTGFSLSAPIFALTVVECVDKDGGAIFAERCPPGTEKKGEKRLRGVAISAGDEMSVEEIAEAHPVTLFSVENCEACVLVRTQLQARDIPFTEIDVGNDRDKYDQLTAATGGTATVPTLTIDDKVLMGHNSASLEAALTDAGYP